MIKTIWQPSYTPPGIEPACSNEKPSSTKKRAYLLFHRSQTAKTIFNLIKTHDGLSASDLIGKTKNTGAHLYVKTLEEDGLVICKLKPVPHVHQLIKHYWINHE